MQLFSSDKCRLGRAGHEAIRLPTGQYALDNGLTVGKSSEGAIGKKVFNPLKTAGAVNRNEPTKKTKIEKTKEGLVVNGKLRKYKTIPNEKKLVEYYIKTGKSPEEAQKDARTTINQHKAWNEKMDDIAKVSEANGGEIDFCNFGDVSNTEGRKQTITTILKGVSSGFLSELKKYIKLLGLNGVSHDDFDNLNGTYLYKSMFGIEFKEMFVAVLIRLNSESSFEINFL